MFVACFSPHLFVCRNRTVIVSGVALGRTRNGRRPSDAAEQAQPEQQPDHELESYLAALNPEESTETTGTGQRFGSSQVYQLRLPLMANERLKELAARQGTSPSALAREWIMQRLSDEPDQPRTPQPQQPEPTQQVAVAPQEAPAQQPAWPTESPQQSVHGTPTQPAHPVAPHAPAPQQQYAGDLQGSQGDQYVPVEADTEITVPQGQYRYS